MCTIVVINHHHKEFPLIIAANRDEDYKRASLPVQILSREPNLVIGGKDKEYGGSWLAVNGQSLFAAITNQGADRNPKLKSRGTIVMEALKCKTLNDLISFVEEINPAEYNPFNLVFGNQDTIFVAHSYILHGMVIRELSKGINVITSDMRFTGEKPQALFAHKKLDKSTDLPWLEYYKVIKKMISSADNGFRLKVKKASNGKFHGVCTRSSSILAFSSDGLARYKFYDRTAKRPARKEGDPYIPRYKDYIDIWRYPDGTPDGKAMATAEEKDDEKESIEEETEPKRFISSYIWKGGDDPTDYDLDDGYDKY